MSFSAKNAKKFGVDNDGIHTYQHLAFHYVAAVLNGLNPDNGVLPSIISTKMGEAETIFINNPDMFLSPGEETEAKVITSILAEFNEGTYDINWPHCEDFEINIIQWLNDLYSSIIIKFWY